jgi:predicted ATPase
MHLKKILLRPERYPDRTYYPFNIPTFNETRNIALTENITLFVGENGTGKSTLLTAIARKCDIHIWEPWEGTRYHHNKYERQLYRYIDVEWKDGTVPGSFFASEIFKNFAQILDEWAAVSPETLKYFGGRSLMTQSHGQCHMSFFKSRFKIKGLYLLDEPENALSPTKQLELLKILHEMSRVGSAQFIIATHSPILLAFPGAAVLSFDHTPIQRINYEHTNHYKIYRSFLNDRKIFLGSLDGEGQYLDSDHSTKDGEK